MMTAEQLKEKLNRDLTERETCIHVVMSRDKAYRCHVNNNKIVYEKERSDYGFTEKRN